MLLVAEHDTPARQFLADNFVADGYDVIPAADYDGAVRALTGDRQVATMIVDLASDTLRLIDAIRAMITASTPGCRSWPSSALPIRCIVSGCSSAAPKT